MMIPQVDRLTKGRKMALCTIIAVFAAFLVIGTTWSRGGGGGGGGGDDGGGGGRVHTSTTGQCIVCHGTSLTSIHQESWSTTRTGCYICHPTGRRDLYDYLADASFDCLSCHDLSGEPVDYHMNIDTEHVSTEAVCMKCHSTGIIPEIPSASLPEVHQGLGEEGHFPLTVNCPSAVAEIEDDIYCYCLECHVNPVPDNANCTSCHEAESYNPLLNQCPHEGVDSHEMCTDCHIPCTE